MPVPVIVWWSVAGVCALVGVISGGIAVSRIGGAKERYEQRRAKYERAMKRCEGRYKHASSRFDQLGKTRLEAVVTLGKAVEFLERAKIKDRKLFEKFDITPEQLVQWKTASVRAVEVLGGVAGSAASGVATAAACYGLVGTLATAGTGTAISALSGAAATNATLAWLGGGSIAAGGGGVAAGTLVLGGLVVGPAILVASFFAHGTAGDIENQVDRHISEMDVDEANKKKLVAALKAVVSRVDELEERTVELRSKLEQLLDSCSPTNEEEAYMVARAAVSLGALLEIAILDKSGKLI
jgi:hypothetical protein